MSLGPGFLQRFQTWSPSRADLRRRWRLPGYQRPQRSGCSGSCGRMPQELARSGAWLLGGGSLQGLGPTCLGTGRRYNKRAATTAKNLRKARL